MFKDYFTDKALKAKMDAFARELGYKDAISVPKDERALFIDMLAEQDAKLAFRIRTNWD